MAKDQMFSQMYQAAVARLTGRDPAQICSKQAAGYPNPVIFLSSSKGWLL